MHNHLTLEKGSLFSGLSSINDSATAIHYDRDPSFFAAFLDPYLKYSTGIFGPGVMDFEQAALAALDRSIELAGCSAKSRVLEIGSGWGSLARRLSERFPGISYTSVNPSTRQNMVIRAMMPDAHLMQGDFEKMTGLAGPFDAIFLLGSFCHMKDKPLLLNRLASLLTDDGSLVMEDSWFCTTRLYAMHAQRPETTFVQQDIFGFAHITSLTEFFAQADEAELHPTQMLDTTLDYAKTIGAWMQNLQRLDCSQYPLRDAYLKYLSIGQASMGYTIGNYIFALKKALGPKISDVLRLARMKRSFAMMRH